MTADFSNNVLGYLTESMDHLRIIWGWFIFAIVITIIVVVVAIVVVIGVVIKEAAWCTYKFPFSTDVWPRSQHNQQIVFLGQSKELTDVLLSTEVVLTRRAFVDIPWDITVITRDKK